jgi:tRNA (guanine37-N1)-methyltransferase
VLDDQRVRALASEPNLILVCGRYGGIDERLRHACQLEELCIGDYILSGGELAALVVIDAVARLQPGVLGNEVSAQAESFADGLLEAPQFTRPRQWRELDVPEVLMGGHHAQIKSWRRSVAILVTAASRADLLPRAGLKKSEVRAAIALFEALSESERRSCGLPVAGHELLLRLSALHATA